MWDLRPKEKSTNEPAALWDDLAGTDGPAAYRADLGAGGHARSSGRALAREAAPEPPPDPTRVRKLIGELDDPKFATRSAAQAELSKLGARASGPLREALEKAASAEQRERLNKLLADIRAAERPVELRNRRAVTVLTWIGTPEARALLEEWSKADADGSLGGPAAAALKREWINASARPPPCASTADP